MKLRQYREKTFGFLRLLLDDFSSDNVLKLAASLAYSMLFTLPALLIILLWVSSIFYNPVHVQDTLFGQMNGLVGPKAAEQIRQLMLNAHFDYDSGWAKILGTTILVISATGVFGEIQGSINIIWGLRKRPHSGILKLFINRLLSFSIVISLGFILVVSLVANALITSLAGRIQQHFPGVPVIIYYVINQVLMCGVLIVLFGAIFKVLPDARIKWKDVFFSALVTTLLFMGGKYAIEYILTHNSTVSLYGSAGAVIVLLLWVYYSAIILYLGAEITQAWLKLKGRHIEPNRYAVWVEKRAVAVDSNTEVNKENKPVSKEETRSVA